MRISTGDVDQFWRGYGEWQQRVIDAFSETMSKTGRGDLVDPVVKTSLNLSEMLSQLPSSKKRELTKEYRNLLGFDDAIEAALDDPANLLREVGTASPGKNRYMTLRVNPADLTDPTKNPRAFLLSLLNIQYDETGTRGPVSFKGPGKVSGRTGSYWFGSNIPSLEYAKTIADDTAARSAFSSGKKVLVFDTETVGLSTDMAGVRQVAGVMFDQQGGSGPLRQLRSFDERLKTSRMQFGSIYDAGLGRTVSLGDWEAGQIAGYGDMLAGSGDEFARALRPLLESIDAADYVVGHNVQFDIGQTLTNAMKTAYYNSGQDADFTRMVDSAVSKVMGGGVIDTLSMAKKQLPGLDLARELDFAGRKGAYGLENLILSTNLVPMMVGDMTKSIGRDATESFFLEGAQHTADYDATVTAYLLKYLSEGTLKKQALSKKGLFGSIYANTLRSRAITPVTKISDVNQLDPKLFRQLIEGDLGTNFKILDLERNAEISTFKPGTADQWAARLADSNNTRYVLRSDVTFLEQEAWASRRSTAHISTAAGVSAEDMAMGSGLWRRFAGVDTPHEGMLNADSTIFKMGYRPSEREFTKMVSSMAALGNPFADLSVPERMMTNAIGAAIGMADSSVGRMLPAEEYKAARVMDDLGVLHFAAQNQFHVSSRVSVPLEVMMAAEEKGVIGTRFGATAGDMQMMTLSPFESYEGVKSLNIGVDVTDKDISSLSKWLSGLKFDEKISGDKTLADYGISTPEELDKVLLGLEQKGSRYGLAVGYLDDEAGEAAYRAITNFVGDVDEGRPAFSVAYHSSETTAEGLRYMRSGPVMATGIMSKAEKLGLRAKMTTAVSHFTEAGKWLDQGQNFTAALESQGASTAKNVGRTMLDMVKDGEAREAYKFLKENVLTKSRRPWVALGALAVGVGTLALGRHKENKPWVEPFDQMPIDFTPRQPRPESIPQAPVIPRGSSMDPLVMAGTTGTMYNMRDNHRVMDRKSKYNNVFSGVLTGG